MNEKKGTPSPKNQRIAIVGSCFNLPIANALVSGAKEEFLSLGGRPEDLTVIRVPGAFEIPCTIKKLLQTSSFHAVVACGVLIEGETAHFRLIADQVAAGIRELTLGFTTPITFSIITAPSVEAAWERAGIKGPNLGASGMRTALEMGNLFQQLS